MLSKINEHHSLIEKPVDEIEINDHKYKVNFAFNNVIKCYDLLDPEKVTENILLAVFVMLVPDVDPKELTKKEALEYLALLMDYINYHPYGQEISTDNVTQSEGDQDFFDDDLIDDTPDKYYDFKQDAGAIYASFKIYAGIDLYDQIDQLHWDKFQALLMALPEKSMFKQIVSIRQKQLTVDESKDAQYVSSVMQQKQYYALKTSRYERNKTIYG